MITKCLENVDENVNIMLYSSRKSESMVRIYSSSILWKQSIFSFFFCGKLKNIFIGKLIKYLLLGISIRKQEGSKFILIPAIKYLQLSFLRYFSYIKKTKFYFWKPSKRIIESLLFQTSFYKKVSKWLSKSNIHCLFSFIF